MTKADQPPKKLEGFDASRPKALLVEGVDEQRLLPRLLRHLQIDIIAVRSYEGITKLAEMLKTLRTAASGFENVTTLGIWRDAEHSPTGALQSVQYALSRAGFPSPKRSGEFADGEPCRVGVLILPDGKSPGAIENICLESADDPLALGCVDAYVECLKGADVHLHPNHAKAKVHAYLASRRKPGLKIGEAANANYWDFTHPAWEPIRRFLQQM